MLVRVADVASARTVVPGLTPEPSALRRVDTQCERLLVRNALSIDGIRSHASRTPS